MSEHRVSLAWSRGERDFHPDTYPRAHAWRFDDGTPEIRVSAAPGYRGDADALDPEQAMVGALSSCHMLTFLAIAAKQGQVVDAYEDNATGTLARDETGRMALTEVVLRPRITLAGDPRPDPAGLAELHDKAHRYCFIANSVKTRVRIEAP